MSLSKIIISSLLALSTSAASAATATKPAAEAKPIAIYDSEENRNKLIEELLDVTNSKETIETSFASASKFMLKDNKDPEKAKAVEAIFQKYYSWEKLAPIFYQIYNEVYSAEEIHEIVEFYKSKAGQKMISKMPELMEKTNEAMIKISQENMPKMMPELAKFLDQGEKDKGEAAKK